LLSLLASPKVIADDTEVYIGSNSSSSVRPNVLFIVDTSGSMNSDVQISVTSTVGATYDPTVDYSAEGNCVAGRVYWSSNGTPNDCSSGSRSNNDYFVESANRCSASYTALANTGFYTTRAARYNVRNKEDRWSSLSDREPTELVDCEDDWGIHGKNTGDGLVYPADEYSGGPWTSNVNNGINWSNKGGNYTLYNGNYLNWYNATGGGTGTTTTTMSRLQVVQNVFSDLIDSISSINIGVMRFDRDAGTNDDTDGGYFIMPMQALSDANRADYKNAVNALTANGYTPLAETLYEAYLFYNGGAVDYGDSSEPGVNVSGVLDPTDTTHYNSPVDYQCQKNFVILLTDGEPTQDTGADAKIAGLPGFSAITGGSTCTGSCLDELADYMHSSDCSTAFSDTQNVITYTIGFATNQALLNDAATKGGGDYYTANDAAQLTNAFTNIITEILAVNTTFTAPAVSVNAFNRFIHNNELYYALFRPASTPKWAGNVKLYKLDSSGTNPVVVDANGDPAVDDNTGIFKASATSFWTPLADAPDGEDVDIGGAASKLALPRTIYTYTGAGAPSNTTLTSTHALSETNSAVTKTMLGNAAMTDARRSQILQWARGVDVLDDDSDSFVDDARRSIGSMIHTKPVLITYGGTANAPDMTLFAGSNEGYLHAINTSDGTEIFSFVPQELLPELATFFDDNGADAHPYGLDGALTYWINDANDNGVLYDTNNTLETGEFIYLYQGMRRGGSNYYALDVTNRSAPVLKWIINGGSGDFSELGQTWSGATKAKIKLNGTDKDVLIFGGGYDVNQDSNALASDDSIGRAIYIVDANTGAKIWQAGPAGTGNASGGNPNLILSGMTNSIPSDIRVIDIDDDGYADRMYVGDTRAQLWRFDIDINNTAASNLATGGVIATLGGSTAELNRRFYYAPDVSLSQKKDYLNIAIGSGYRAHPLNTVIQDAFFVIRDTNVLGPATDVNGNPVYTALTISDLYDTTDNVIGEGTAAQITTAKASLQSSDGWYINLSNSGTYVGEKVLAHAVTLYGKTMFTTFTPVDSGSSSSCSPSQGNAQVYAVNTEDGTPYVDSDNSGGDLNAADRHIGLTRGGIPPEVTLVLDDSGNIVPMVATEILLDLDFNQTPQKTYWRVE